MTPKIRIKDIEKLNTEITKKRDRMVALLNSTVQAIANKENLDIYYHVFDSSWYVSCAGEYDWQRVDNCAESLKPIFDTLYRLGAIAYNLGLSRQLIIKTLANLAKKS